MLKARLCRFTHLALMKRIRTVTLNPAVDISATTDVVISTEKLRCRAVRRDAGGGGINVARVVKRLGAKVEMVFPAGGPGGQILSQLLTQEDTAFRVVPIAGETREDFTILDESAGRQYRFVFPGPVLTEVESEACLAAATDGEFDINCASGSLPPAAALDMYARLAAQYHRKGEKFLLDTSGPALEAALKAPIFLIKPNLRELSGLVKKPLETEQSKLRACLSLLESFPLQLVALSLGADGALLVSRQGAWRAACPQTQAVSTVGAGDSFMGGLVWALAASLSPQDMLRCAVAAGTAAVMAPGTELCHADDVWRLRKQVQICELEPATLSDG